MVTASGAHHPCWPLPPVLMARLTARGAANFLRETVARVRHAGATGALTVRADSGFYAHTIVAVCRKICTLLHHHCRNAPSPIRRSLRESTRRRTSAPHRPQGEAHARLLAFFTNYSYHGFITARGRGSRPPPTRRGGERHPRPEVRVRTEPRALGTLCPAWFVQVMAHNLALDLPHRTGRTSLHHQDPAQTVSPDGTRSARVSPCIFGGKHSSAALSRLRTIPLPN